MTKATTQIQSLTHEQSKYFRDQFREARALALADSESFHKLLFVIEELGMMLSKQSLNLGKYLDYIEKVAEESPLAEDMPRLWHTPFSILYDEVRIARNDAMHQGAFARHLTSNAIKIAIIMEDALMTDFTKIGDYMVQDPIEAFDWQPISFVRQQMLMNSYTFIPIYYEGKTNQQKWYLISDYNIANYLKGDLELLNTDDKRGDRKTRLARTVKDAVENEYLDLEEAITRTYSTPVDEAISLMKNGKPILVTGENNNLIGIVTSFDLL